MNIGPPVMIPRRAFSLIELLAVVSVMAILTAILIPVIGQMRKAAAEARCTSNLHNIGRAIVLYVQDNDGRLPGPLNGGQGSPVAGNPGFTQYFSGDPAVNGNGDNSLPYHIGPYMGLAPVNRNRLTHLFICPSYESTGPSYILATRFDATKGAGTDHSNNGYRDDLPFPFGYPNRSPGPGDASDKYQPKRLGDINAFPIAAGKLWAMADLDRMIPGGVEDAGWKQNIPQSPIHLRGRNALFFDWHVGKLDVNSDVPIRN